MNSGSAEQCNNVSWISLCLLIDAVIVLLCFELELFMWCDVWHFFQRSYLASSPKSSSTSEFILQFLFPSHICQLSTCSSEITLISLHFMFLQAQKHEIIVKIQQFEFGPESLDSLFSRRKFWVQLPQFFFVTSFLEREKSDLKRTSCTGRGAEGFCWADFPADKETILFLKCLNPFFFSYQKLWSGSGLTSSFECHSGLLFFFTRIT